MRMGLSGVPSAKLHLILNFNPKSRRSAGVRLPQSKVEWKKGEGREGEGGG